MLFDFGFGRVCVFFLFLFARIVLEIVVWCGMVETGLRFICWWFVFTYYISMCTMHILYSIHIYVHDTHTHSIACLRYQARWPRLLCLYSFVRDVCVCVLTCLCFAVQTTSMMVVLFVVFGLANRSIDLSLDFRSHSVPCIYFFICSLLLLLLLLYLNLICLPRNKSDRLCVILLLRVKRINKINWNCIVSVFIISFVCLFVCV